MRVGGKFNLFIGAIAIAVCTAVTIGTTMFEHLRIGGPVYREVAESQALTADILPPPLYLVEAYLEVNLLHESRQAADETTAHLAAQKRDYFARLDHWKESALPESVKALIEAKTAPPALRFWKVVEEDYLPAVARKDQAAVDTALADLASSFKAHRAAVLELVGEANALSERIETGAIDHARTAFAVQIALGLLVLLTLAVGTAAFRAIVVRPLGILAFNIYELASGRLETAKPLKPRHDEIGEMSEALGVFRTAETERRDLFERTESDRRLNETQRERQAAIDGAKAEDLRAFVHGVEAGFERLAAGDLTVRMDGAVAPEFEPIRQRFNASVEALEETIGAVVGAVGSMRTGLQEITVAAGDLSQRTEQQAASLEETVAALSEVVQGVGRTAESADDARAAATLAQGEAQKGGQVVAEAVAAMAEIEASSDRIGNIISVIDEIAFQTNLLALNAGVEAARAGEAGRGFAVVAQEVRGLAQRSAEAAKEIKDLIQASSAQVGRGVDLVSASGRSLERIVGQVEEVSTVITGMARSAREQSVSLREVSVAADQMDKVTQQNAAMVEETTAAAQNLVGETEQLAGMTERFRTGRGSALGARPARAIAPAARPAPRAAPAPVRQMRPAVQPQAQTQAARDDWEEF